MEGIKLRKKAERKGFSAPCNYPSAGDVQVAGQSFQHKFLWHQ